MTQFLAVASYNPLLFLAVAIGGIALMFAVGVPWMSKMGFGVGIIWIIINAYFSALCLLLHNIEPNSGILGDCIAGLIVCNFLFFIAYFSKRKS